MCQAFVPFLNLFSLLLTLRETVHFFHSRAHPREDGVDTEVKQE